MFCIQVPLLLSCIVLCIAVGPTGTDIVTTAATGLEMSADASTGELM